MRKTRIPIALAGLATAVLTGFGGPAAADPTQYPFVLDENFQEWSLNNHPNTSNENVSCNLESYGSAVLQHVNALVAETVATDAAASNAVCVNIDQGAPPYSIVAELRIQYYVKAGYVNEFTWQSASRCSSRLAGSTSNRGVTQVTLTNNCTWPAFEPIGNGNFEPSPYLNTYHRAQVCVRSSQFAEKCENSPTVWWMAP